MMKPFKVFHILVKHEYEAQDIIKKLHEGMSFTQAAMKFSSCASARDGGALGPYKPGRFVETFDEAVTVLPLDTISPPIRTQFGYHIILKK
jgi:peptidyl-prolyl cis-trans isomerase C